MSYFNDQRNGRFNKGSQSKYKNFLEFLVPMVNGRDKVRVSLSRIILRDVDRGAGNAFYGKDLALPQMTRTLLALNAPEQVVAEMKNVLNEWNKFLADEQAEYRKQQEDAKNKRNGKGPRGIK